MNILKHEKIVFEIIGKKANKNFPIKTKDGDIGGRSKLQSCQQEILNQVPQLSLSLCHVSSCLFFSLSVSPSLFLTLSLSLFLFTIPFYLSLFFYSLFLLSHALSPPFSLSNSLLYVTLSYMYLSLTNTRNLWSILSRSECPQKGCMSVSRLNGDPTPQQTKDRVVDSILIKLPSFSQTSPGT